MSYRGVPAGFEDEEDDLDSLGSMTQKITIVPDISSGAGLNGEDFDRSLSVDVDNWFDNYRERWNSYKRTPAAQHNLKLLFLKDPQPLLLALKLFANCPGCNNLKNKNLALFILETICDLYKSQPEIAATCDDNTRMIAFNFVKTSGVVPLYKAVMATYELNKIRDLLVPKIRELIAKGHFKDAAYWTMHLQVTQLFGIFDIVFPLILQDKVYLAEEYLNVAKEQILPTVQFLDSLLHKQKTVMELCDEILTKYKYVDVKHGVLSYRPMSKLVLRLAKKYKIEAHHTPNLNFTKACSYMNYLWHKYQDGGMSFESWRELVRDTASTKPLQLDLITNIASFGDYDEAIYWVKYFNVPLDDCPSTVKAKLSQHSSENPTEADSNGSADSTADSSTDGAAALKSKKSNSFLARKYLTLDLPADAIILVDASAGFLEMLAYLEQQRLVAFDSEWKPAVCNENVVSLLQLATEERVYLLDCLSAQLSDDLWQQLGRKIFNNLEILKIGFSLHQDLRMLQKSLPLQLNLQATACYLDLREMWRRLKYIQIVTFPYGNGLNAGESLSALTELCLGKKLDKSNQFSNWANRPLRPDQIVYAALDAHCLLQVYQVLSEILLRMGLDIDQVVDEITTAKTGYLYRMKQIVSNQNAKEPEEISMNSAKCESTALESDPNSATNFKFICDSMLYGLSKELRKLGIDCVDVLKLNLNYYIDLAKRENRYVLTRDVRYALFSSELPEAQCVQIPSDSSVEQVLNVISLLNIKICKRDLFTRCLQCNGNEFIMALKEEMQVMRFGQAQHCAATSLDIVGRNPPDKASQCLTVNEHIMNTKTTYRGRVIKLDRIKPHILRSKKRFFICDNCGVCSWKGAHPIHRSIMNVVATDSRDNVHQGTNATQ